MALITWAETSVTVNVGDTVTVDFTYGKEYGEYFDTRITTSDTGVATITTSGQYLQFGGTATITGVSAGTATVVPGPRDTQNTPLTIIVTAPAPVEDDKFLNKRGLTHFWENIDEIKQDKLTAGTNITIAADNTISASQPTVNDATLTIQRNGTNVQTFTANASSNVTANISVPTKTSDLTNDGSDNTAQYLETDETAYKTASIPYGQCDSTSTATVFTATVPGVTELRDGVCMWLKNGVVTSASGFTININNLGAKPVYNNMAADTRDTTIWNINYTMFFVYDSTRVEGGCWILYRGYNSDNNTIGYQLRTNSTSLTTTDRTRYYRLLFTSADNTHWVPANTQYDNSATSNKTINQRKINPFGRIVYLGNSTSYLADAAVSATAIWDQYAFNLGYSFSKGSALTMTYPKPVYVKCAPQSDGSAIIDSTTPYVQDLPSTDDGKIYIYLGVAYNATNVEMVINHPIYYYKDGAIREWSNAPAAIASVAWGDITGTLSNQTDLNTALGAKANSADLATVATSGDYDDLTDKPTIGNATLTIQKNGASAGTFTANATSNKTINITVPTTAADVSALPASTKYGASIAVSVNTTDYKVTTTLKDQDGNTLGTAQVIDLPLESVVVNGSYDNTNKKIILTLQNGNTIDIPVADLVAGLQSEITSSNKLSSDLVDDTNHTHKFVTAAQITKLNGIAAGAEVNVQADWDQTTTTADDYIKNKPSLATVATSGSYNDLSDKPTIPAAQVNSDWNATSGKAQILNKPTLATVATSGSYNDLSNKPTIPAAQVQSNWTQTTTTAVDYIKNKPTLATVATSGSYNDLSNKPTIPDKQVFYGTSNSSGSLSNKTVVCSGFTYAEGNVIYVTFSDADTYSGDSSMTMNVNSTGAKIIFTQTTSGGGLQSDYKWAAGETVCFVCHDDYYLMVEAAMATTTTSGLMSVNDKNKLDGIAAGAEVNVQSDWNVTNAASDAFIKNKPTLATVATSGSYDDLSDKPTIPAAQVQSDWTQTTTTAVDYIKNKPALSAVATSGSYSDLSDKPTIPAAQVNSDWNASSGVAQILNKPTLSTVATSGSYNDLSDKPTIPTVNDATLTIKQNATTLGTFTANASTGTTVTISTPTRTTIYNNGSGTNANFSTTSAMSNYDDVEITFRDGNSNYATRTVPGSAGSFVLDISHPGGSSTVYWYVSRFIVGGTNITVGANNVRKAISTTISSTNTQDIYITKMVGIKY